eukprot:TRINITY_DN9734_c0_g1_i2.p2 TRINITY_DN9734_c0_g1~~TRINITY_DN9734_c0_g1_i2.p2  ORF type:complete len:155 (+),score=3.53 TRINITY_DN9734_c0_g1_i2:151-615(+)
MFHLKAKSATHNHAQLTVLWQIGANGQNAIRHAVLDNKHEPEELLFQPTLVEDHVQLHKKFSHATPTHAQLIVLWETGANGLHVTRPVNQENHTEHALSLKNLLLEERYVPIHVKTQFATLNRAQLTVFTTNGVNGHHVTDLVEVELQEEPAKY